MPLTEPIESPPLKDFCDQSMRTLADLLAGIFDLPKAILDTVEGKQFCELLGTADADLTREEGWLPEDYMAMGAPQEIVGSDNGNRTKLTNYDVVALLRVVVVLKQMQEANPQLGPLIRKFAVNPINIRR